jgi:glucose-6-phosphate isomerase
MSVTAARLGSAPLTLDWSHLGKSSAAGADSAEAWTQLKGRFAKGEIGFYDTPLASPEGDELSQAKASEQLAAEILAKGHFTDCLFLGIGGSSLGPLSVLSALQDRRQNKLRFHFMENPDPLEWSGTLKGLDPSSTLVCVVTKSGTTFETMAQFLCALDWLGEKRVPSHVVAITDPQKGDLKAFAAQQKIPTLHIAPSVGGRFSVFTPVGLFALALAGLSVTDFLLGAKQVRDFAEKSPVEKNPLFIIGSELIRHFNKRPIHVCMPYSTRLKSMSSWFVQLWGESLGKDGKGFTPLAAVGATDQHSILQLLRDGPDDKVTWFVTIDKVADPVKIPRPELKGTTTAQYAAFRLLQGHTLQELLTVEYRAISQVLTRQNRPNLSIQLDQLDERSVGALYFAFSVLTAFTGTLWGVNPFDQPGVEEGKIYIRDSLTQSAETQRQEFADDDNSPVARLRLGRADN